MEEEHRRGSGREEKRVDGVKVEICYGGLGGREISNARREKKRKKTYRLDSADIPGTMDVDDFWTELLANIRACRYKLNETIGVL